MSPPVASGSPALPPASLPNAPRDRVRPTSVFWRRNSSWRPGKATRRVVAIREVGSPPTPAPSPRKAPGPPTPEPSKRKAPGPPTLAMVAASPAVARKPHQHRELPTLRTARADDRAARRVSSSAPERLRCLMERLPTRRQHPRGPSAPVRSLLTLRRRHRTLLLHPTLPLRCPGMQHPQPRSSRTPHCLPHHSTARMLRHPNGLPLPPPCPSNDAPSLRRFPPLLHRLALRASARSPKALPASSKPTR